MALRALPLVGMLVGLEVALAAASLAQPGTGNQTGRAAQAAQPRSAAPHPAGPLARPQDALISQATDAIAGRDYQTAYRVLVQVYALAPSTALYHLATLAAAEQRPVEARDLLRRFLADPTVELDSPLRGAAQRQLEQLPVVEAGELSVGAPRGAQVQVDARLVGTVPLAAPLLLSTGRHRIAVSQGRWSAETEVQIRTARLAEVRFKAGSEVAVVSLPGAVLYCDREQPKGAGAGPSFDAAADPLTQALETSVKRENYVLVLRSRALAYAHDLPACQRATSLDCCEALARRYSVDYVLDVESTRAGDNAQHLVVLRDVQVSDTAASGSLSCPGCSADKLAGRLGEKVGQLLAEAAYRPRGTLEVTSSPAGAAVWLDGRRAGTTPYQRTLWPGTYKLEVRQPGFRSQPQTVEIGTEAPARVEVALEQQQAPELDLAASARTSPAPAKRPLWRYAVGGSALGAGVLLIGFGAAGLAANGTCAVDELPAGAACPRAYSTLGVGGALVGVGSALAVIGAVTIAIPPRGRPATLRPAATPTVR